VSKRLFINLLDADLNLAATIPEKIEGLTWGPDLPDGRQQQIIPGPLFPPGQVKKALR
jgi:hypothetical protein